MTARHESLFGISKETTYQVRLKGSDGQVVETYGGMVIGFKRNRRRYMVRTIEEAGLGQVRDQEYPLETMLTGRTEVLDLDLDVPPSPDLTGMKRIFTLSRLYRQGAERVRMD